MPAVSAARPTSRVRHVGIRQNNASILKGGVLLCLWLVSLADHTCACSCVAISTASKPSCIWIQPLLLRPSHKPQCFKRTVRDVQGRTIRPSSASTSRTRMPLARPPMLGLQLIWPILAAGAGVMSSVLAPRRAAAAAASQPAVQHTTLYLLLGA